MGPSLNFFPASLTTDGLMDLQTIRGDAGAWKSIGLQLSMEKPGYFDSPLVDYRKVSAYRIVPRTQDPTGVISIDGESLPYGPFQCEIHPALGRTLSKSGGFENPGPSDWRSAARPQDKSV